MRLLASAAIACFVLIIVDQELNDGRYFRVATAMLRQIGASLGVHF
jgi:hypothetical protein